MRITKKAIVALAFVLAVAPALANVETWKNVTLVDTMCASKIKNDPDGHTRACALACAKSGFGILTSDGSFLEFDPAGNDQALKALKGTKKADHLRVTVVGEMENGHLKVQSLAFD